ncbi:alpha/beta hydrolase family protein [Algimonas arctica]|uniref:alpha/beta hydrolase family protein n=1 Tax=Algimonas arctica TaxID=1479486 RepID=UPI001F385177|nr:alpha/beta fold hydrolase [Algimonas arctica]
MRPKAALYFLMSVSCAIVLALFATTISAQAQSVSDFAGATYFEHVGLSPDGDHYSMVRFGQGGSSEARVYNRRTGRRVGGLTIPGGMDFTWVEWASNTTLLASVSTRFKVDGRKLHLPTARIFSYDIKERREPVILFDNEDRILRTNIQLNRVVDMLPADPDNIIMGAWRNGDFDLYYVNVENGQAARIAKGRQLTLAWFTDAGGQPSLRMDCVGKKCRKINLYRPEDGANPSDAKTDWRYLRSFEQNDSQDETFLKLQPIGPTGKADEFYVLDGRDELPRRSVRIFNVQTNEFVSTLYTDDTYDVSGILIDPKTRAYMGAQVWRDRIDNDLVDPELQEHMDELNKYFDGPWNVSLHEISEDRSAALVFASASNEPGAYYIYDFETRDTKRIVRVNRNLHNSIRTDTTVVSVPTRDGQQLTGYLTVPKQDANGKMVVLVHGGPEQRDVLDYDRDVQFLASRGYTVARVNFRGSSGYGRTFAQAGYRQWGGTMHTDVIDATVWFQKQHSIAPNETCIMGYSYGAYAALLAGAMQAQLYNCVIAGGGPTDLNQLLKDERKAYGSDSPQYAYWEKSIGERKTQRSELASISPVHLAKYYDDPILLVHGEYDRVVQPDHASQMESALLKAGQSVEYIELNGGHQYSTWSRKSDIIYLKKIEEFLAKHLPDNSTSSDEKVAP